MLIPTNLNWGERAEHMVSIPSPAGRLSILRGDVDDKICESGSVLREERWGHRRFSPLHGIVRLTDQGPQFKKWTYHPLQNIQKLWIQRQLQFLNKWKN